tara:strand:- start:13 stop:306 length:294 start_codon:yes stop_codon:yes gene_type:complete
MDVTANPVEKLAAEALTIVVAVVSIIALFRDFAIPMGDVERMLTGNNATTFVLSFAIAYSVTQNFVTATISVVAFHAMKFLAEIGVKNPSSEQEKKL